MSKRLAILSLFVAASLFAALGCDDDKPAVESTAAPSAKVDSTASNQEVRKPTGAAAAKFSMEMVAKGCKVITACKNDEIRSLIRERLMITAAVEIGTRLERTDAGAMKADPDVKKVAEQMKADHRTALTEDECALIGTKLANLLGIGGDVLPKLVADKRIVFDADQAKQCMKSLASAPKSCSEDKKLEGEMTMAQLSEIDGKYKDELDAYFKPCGDAFEGQVKIGETCTYDFECAGSARCKAQDPKKKDDKTCVAQK